MTATSHATPLAAWEAFAAAIAARDADAARRAATEGAWRNHGDSAVTVYQTASEGGFSLTVSGPAWIEDDRAVLPVRIERGGRSSTLYALLEQRDGSWSVSAGIRDERQASLFLAGVLPAAFEVTDLGPSPEGEQRARARSEELSSSPAAAGQPVKTLGVHALPQRGRVLVGLQHLEGGARPVDEWVCLDTADGAPRELGRSSYPSLGLLLTGIEATLPAREAPASDAKDQASDEESWKIINTFLQTLAEVAGSARPPADQSGGAPQALPEAAPQALPEALARTMEAAGQHREAAALRQQVALQAAGAGTGDQAPPPEPGPPSRDAMEPVRQELQRAIDAFRQEKGLEANVSIVDKQFLATHGQELSGRLLRVLANALPVHLRPAMQSLGAPPPDTSTSSGTPSTGSGTPSTGSGTPSTGGSGADGQS